MGNEVQMKGIRYFSTENCVCLFFSSSPIKQNLTAGSKTNMDAIKYVISGGNTEISPDATTFPDTDCLSCHDQTSTQQSTQVGVDVPVAVVKSG
jgi:hypothetical protein